VLAPRGSLPTTDHRPGKTAAWWHFAEHACAQLTAAEVDRPEADRELARLLLESRLGAVANRAVKALEIAWHESRTRAAARWLLGR
jgi:hypothetical protein